MQRNYVRRSSSVPASDPRRGSTLLIVLALMGLLAVLGFLFYTFAAQENASATSFSNESRVLIAPGLEEDDLFDIALQQLILGPDEFKIHSAIWGSRHALATNMLGTDGIPFNGEGVHLIDDGNNLGIPAVDQDYNGTAEGARLALREPNDSPAANNGYLWQSGSAKDPTSSPGIPQPDTEYTYPDINHMFLAYKGQGINASGTPVDVMIPSFHRPQYLRSTGAGGHDTSWKTSSNGNFSVRTMRPHPSHQTLDVSSLGNTITIPGSTTAWTAPVTGSGNKPIYRFFGPDGAPGVVGVDDDGNGTTDFDSMTGLPDLAEVDFPGSFCDDFPFRGPRVNATTTQAISEGVWDSSGTIRYDLDLDGDGIREAILMDLDVPAQRRGDGTLVYPMFAFTVYDANGLINLNATGNIAGLLDQYRKFQATNTGNNNWENLSLGIHELGSRFNGATMAWQSDSISKSNQGLSTWEINPTRAMTATPSDSNITNSTSAMNLQNVLLAFGYPSGSQLGRSRSELANLEWLTLLAGRPRFHPQLASAAANITDLVNAANILVAGRNGDIAQLPNFLLSGTPGNGNPYVLPGAGQRTSWTAALPITPTTTPGTDDNSNQAFGEYTNDRFFWPLDNAGSGRWHRRYDWGSDAGPGVAGTDDDQNGITDDIGEEGWQGSDDVATSRPYVGSYRYSSGANNRLLWPTFSGYSRSGGAGFGARWGDINVTGNTTAPRLVPAPPADPLVDEPAESLFEPEILASSFSLASLASTLIGSDSVFGVEENAFLQTGLLDNKNQARKKSRLAELAPANFVEASGALGIRQRFTTISSDRREFGWPTARVGGLNLWETNNGFPPVQTQGTASPFRNELYQMLWNPTIATTPAQHLKLNINRLLTFSGTNYVQRRLTPFTPGTSPWAASEVQAVNDRVNMARDIYTLLYVFCSGNQVTYLNPGNTQRTSEECRQMAQFAVNLVDALDTDDVITQFNYDSDLSDGNWSPPGGSTEVVFGVERQLLTISEGLAFRVQPETNPDSTATIFDDQMTDPANGRRYGFLELQNVTPAGVTLASTSANTRTNAEWRILLVRPGVTGMSQDTALKGVYLQSQLDNAQNGLTATAQGNQVQAGAVFTISSQDGSDTFKSDSSKYRTSDFRADIDVDTYYDRVVPVNDRFGSPVEASPPQDSTNPAQFPLPACNLDLCYNYSSPWTNPGADSTHYIIASPVTPTDLTSDNYTPTATAGAFVQDIAAGMTQIKYVLQRRAVGSGSSLWATVDTFTTDVKTTALATTTATAASVKSEVTDNILSDRRRKPLDRATRTPTATGDTGATGSKINTFNLANVTNNNLWQWHPDRDFASLGELLLLPVYGPDELTAGDSATYPNGMMMYDVIDDTRTDAMSMATYTVKTARTAAGFFRNPLLPQDSSGMAPATAWTSGNRWHRLLQFLEVAPRDHQHPALTGNPEGGSPTAGSTSQTSVHNAGGNYIFEPWNYPIGYGWPRKHGALNLNLIRHSPVWAALLDDDTVIPGIGYDSPSYSDVVDGGARDWWQQLLHTRDGVNGNADPVTNAFLPGTVYSRPFRDWSFASRGNQSVEETILRSLPSDAFSGNPTLQNRHLTELGQITDHQAPDTNSITPAARHRMISKLTNNTTTRSNTFFVFVGVQFHEAAEIDVGSGKRALRIGRKIDEMPVHRGFFVVDRAPLVDQVRTLKSLNGTLPTSSTSYRYLQDTNNGSNPNGLRWRDTILYRQILN